MLSCCINLVDKISLSLPSFPATYHSTAFPVATACSRLRSCCLWPAILRCLNWTCSASCPARPWLNFPSISAGKWNSIDATFPTSLDRRPGILRKWRTKAGEEISRKSGGSRLTTNGCDEKRGRGGGGWALGWFFEGWLLRRTSKQRLDMTKGGETRGFAVLDGEGIERTYRFASDPHGLCGFYFILYFSPNGNCRFIVILSWFEAANVIFWCQLIILDKTSQKCCEGTPHFCSASCGRETHAIPSRDWSYYGS